MQVGSSGQQACNGQHLDGTVDSPGVDGGGATLWGKEPDSHQGTHFMGHEIEAWADKKMTDTGISPCATMPLLPG